MATPRVAVVVLTFQCERYVDACFGALSRASLPDGTLVLAIDNSSRDGTANAIRTRHAWVTLVENPTNLGFAGGNNVGIRTAIERGSEWVYLLNPDTAVEPAFLKEALAVAEATPNAGAIQSLLLLADHPDRINTAGNAIHFLGFGYCGLLGAAIGAAPAKPVEIPFASGAAVLLSARALRTTGLLDEFLFLYHEDLDLGWRLRLAGYANLLAPKSIVLHHYEFSRNVRKYFFMERNRHVVLLKNLSVQSLLVLLPFLFLAELGLLGVSAAAGWLPEKLRALGQLLDAGTWRHVRESRRNAQATRRVSDWEISRHFSYALDLPGLPGGWLPRALAWPMRVVWFLVRPLMSRRSTPRGSLQRSG